MAFQHIDGTGSTRMNQFFLQVDPDGRLRPVRFEYMCPPLSRSDRRSVSSNAPCRHRSTANAYTSATRRGDAARAAHGARSWATRPPRRAMASPASSSFAPTKSPISYRRTTPSQSPFSQPTSAKSFAHAFALCSPPRPATLPRLLDRERISSNSCRSGPTVRHGGVTQVRMTHGCLQPPDDGPHEPSGRRQLCVAHTRTAMLYSRRSSLPVCLHVPASKQEAS